MDAITGEALPTTAPADEPADGAAEPPAAVDADDEALRVVGLDAGSTAASVIRAVVACAARWGIDKTTVDDVAREAGVSRATVYRLFPGGKAELVRLATRLEVVVYLTDLRRELESAADLPAAVAILLCSGSRSLAEHPALSYMRTHQPTRVRSFLSFDRLDLLLGAAADVLTPGLERFLPQVEARTVVVWIARLVISHYVTPDPAAPLSDPAAAARVAAAYVLPGLAADHAPAAHLMPNPAGHTPAPSDPRSHPGVPR